MSDPTFQIAKIVYFTDMTRADAPIIPLGVLSEVKTDHAHGLALKARTALTEAELNLVTPAVREGLKDPFEYLRAQFDSAWEKATPGTALRYLSSGHSNSLSILAPEDCPELGWLASLLMKPRNEALDAKLAAAVNKAFDALMAELSGKDGSQTIIESQELKAA